MNVLLFQECKDRGCGSPFFCGANSEFWLLSLGFGISGSFGFEDLEAERKI